MSRPKNPRSAAGPGRAPSRRSNRPRKDADPQVHRAAKPNQQQDAETPGAGASRPGTMTRLPAGLTWRAVALVIVLVILALSYATSLRAYFNTERENAANKHRIEQSQQRIDDLEVELERWNDPDYVSAQARSRLGWVVPGDTGYRVIGPDGEVLGVNDGTPPPPTPEETGPWWDRMAESVHTADQPPTADPLDEVDPGDDPAEQPPLTDGDRTGN